MKIYYAHCQAIYGTPQQTRDVKLLQDLGFDVINPGTPEHGIACVEYGNQHGNKMGYFFQLVDECDALAFRSLPDGAIPTGIAGEIACARNKHKPIIELPSSILRRIIDLDQTREYLSEIGQR